MSQSTLIARLSPLVLLLSLVWSDAVHAETDTSSQQARELTTAGNMHFEAGRYAEAERAFREAYALSGRPGFLWNMAQCARLSGQSERALLLYRKYLATSTNGSQREEAERWVGMLQLQESKPAAPRPHPATKTDDRPPRRSDSKPRVLVLSDTPAYQEGADSQAVYEKWWFWAGAGAVVTGVVAAVLLSNGSEPSTAPVPEQGTIRW